MANRDRLEPEGFTALSFVWRLVFALALVLLSYNPSGESAYHWVSAAIAESAFGPIHLLLIAVLLIGWAVFWIATWRALGTLGVVLAAVLLGAVVWLLIDIGLLKTDTVTSITWISLVCLAAMLAIGASWSHFWRRFTGQYNVEDVDD